MTNFHNEITNVIFIHSKYMTRQFYTKSGQLLKIGTGSGTKWQWLKKGRPEEEKAQLHNELVDNLLRTINCGYRHLDTAEVYTTQPEVAAAVKKSGIPREEFWITTKYFPGVSHQAALTKGPIEFVNKALKELETDYLDLLLIHHPFVTPGLKDYSSLGDLWKEVIELKRQGLVREIGVSNFAVPHLKEVFESAGTEEFYPVVNQIEFHPFLQNQSKGIVDFCKEHNILIEAYGPLSPLFRADEENENVATFKQFLNELSSKYDKTEAQILLRYTIQKGLLPITTSSNEERIKQSLEVYGFELDDSDVNQIDELGSKFKFRKFFNDQYAAGFD